MGDWPGGQVAGKGLPTPKLALLQSKGVWPISVNLTNPCVYKVSRDVFRWK
jgi:hypothetical protein